MHLTRKIKWTTLFILLTMATILCNVVMVFSAFNSNASSGFKFNYIAPPEMSMNSGTALNASIKQASYSTIDTAIQSIIFDKYNENYYEIIAGTEGQSLSSDNGDDILIYHIWDTNALKFDVYILSDSVIQAPASLTNAFANLQAVKSIVFNNFNTSKTTSMVSMFNGCKALTALDLSCFDTKNVTSMSNMFYKCTALTNINLSSFETPLLNDMAHMFRDCSKLEVLDLSKFNTSKVTTMESTFNGCQSLASLNLSNFNTGNVNRFDATFANLKALTTFDVSMLDTSKATTMSSMFYGCNNLTNLIFGDWNTSAVTSMSSMFYGCSKLQTICVSEYFSTENVETSTRMFYSCSSIVGGNGTIYDNTITDKTYARIDGVDYDGDGVPDKGYFTLKTI